MTTVLPVRRTIDVAALLVVATILAQIVYPLTSGDARDRMTAVVVLAGAAAACVHAARTCGGRGVAAVAAAALVGLLAEIVGVHTGFPFGRYAYAGDLGVRVAGVPLLVVAAWASMAWPAAVVARHLVRGFSARVATGAWALAAWDVFLDPQMVAAGHWTWAAGGARLPGVADVPVSNFGGWFAVSVVISVVVSTVLQGTGRVTAAAARPMLVLYVWTAASSVLAALWFWHRPAVAAWGALAMGPVAVAVLRSRRR